MICLMIDFVAHFESQGSAKIPSWLPDYQGLYLCIDYDNSLHCINYSLWCNLGFLKAIDPIIIHSINWIDVLGDRNDIKGNSSVFCRVFVIYCVQTAHTVKGGSNVCICTLSTSITCNIHQFVM